MQAGWSGWRRVVGMIFDRRISARTTGKVYKTVLRQAILYGLEVVALTKNTRGKAGSSKFCRE